MVQKKNNYDYSKEILDILLENGIIDDDLYLKCSKPSYIQSLPYDNRIADPSKLLERKEAIENEIQDRNSLIDELIETNKEKGENISEGYSDWLSALDTFYRKLPYSSDVHKEYQEELQQLRDNLKELINKGKKFKTELNENIATYGAEKDISDDLEDILWSFKDIEIKLDYQTLDSYMYDKDVIDYVDDIFSPMDIVLNNLRYKTGFKENGIKIHEYNTEVETLTNELTKITDKL